MTYKNPSKQASITRRGLLSAVAAVPVLSLSGWPDRAIAADLDLDAFLGLSQDLTQKDDLDRDIASDMLDAFVSNNRGDALSALASGDEDADLSNAVVAAWYSGVSPDPDAEDVLTYTEALMWNAMSFTKPQGYCGGAPGYWGDAPDV